MNDLNNKIINIFNKKTNHQRINARPLWSVGSKYCGKYKLIKNNDDNILLVFNSKKILIEHNCIVIYKDYVIFEDAEHCLLHLLKLDNCTTPGLLASLIT